jgi:hypothetical protein
MSVIAIFQHLPGEVVRLRVSDAGAFRYTTRYQNNAQASIARTTVTPLSVGETSPETPTAMPAQRIRVSKGCLNREALLSGTCRSHRIRGKFRCRNIESISDRLSSDVDSCRCHCSPGISRFLRTAGIASNQASRTLASSTTIHWVASGVRQAIPLRTPSMSEGRYFSSESIFVIMISRMNKFWIAGAVFIISCAILTIVRIVRDVLPYLEEEDQTCLRGWFGSLGGFNNRSGALRRAWSEHINRFPRSRKRIAFAILLIATVLAVVGYALLH